MIITDAIYQTVNDENRIVRCVINGVESSVSMSEGNSDYEEILRQVESGDLTIADAD